MLEDFPEFEPEDFALYNLSIIVAESEKNMLSFDELKHKVETFFELMVGPLGQVRV